jgi:hypothetical protein
MASLFACNFRWLLCDQGFEVDGRRLLRPFAGAFKQDLQRRLLRGGVVRREEFQGLAGGCGDLGFLDLLADDFQPRERLGESLEGTRLALLVVGKPGVVSPEVV